MSNIDRVGSFRGKVLDRGVSATTNGYPQLVLQLQANEHWNEENQVWEGWHFDECETTAYICLFGKTGKPTLGVGQAQKALNWDGSSLMALQTDVSVEDIQWRMESSTYEGKTRIQVAWIDAYDAEPGRKVKKLDTADIKKLDAQYSAALKAIGGGPKPKSAPPRPPAPAQAAVKADPTPASGEAPTTTTAAASPVSTPTTSEAPLTPDTPAEASVPAAQADTPERPKRGRKPAAPAAPQAAATPVAAPAASIIDQGTAWGAVYSAGKNKGKSDVEITNAWVAVVNEIGGDEKVGSDWSSVRDQAIAKLS